MPISKNDIDKDVEDRMLAKFKTEWFDKINAPHKLIR
jgi:hypothetical protein